MTDQYYQVKLMGEMQGQFTQNTLYYKSEFEITAELFPHAGAEGLATNIKQEIWDGAMKDCVSGHWRLMSIDVMPYNSAFELIYMQPYKLAVNEVGNEAGDALPPSACVNIHFNLAAQNAAQNLVAPKRGYVAIPGVPESAQADGYLDTIWWNDAENRYKKLAKKLAENVQELTPPAIWVPVRLKQAGTIGTALQKWVGAAEVLDAWVDPIVSNRRSRKRMS